MKKTISQLFRLAKMGQKEQFNKILQQSNIMQNMQYLNGHETSLLIFSFNKLKLMNDELQKQCEKLYLDKIYNMNVHDLVMCGLSLKNSNNKIVQFELIESFNQHWSQILQMQEKQPNIGLIAYIASKENNPKNSIWFQIETIFESTMLYQDERNFMTVLFAFSKVQPESKNIWIILEKYIWNKGLINFTDRNKILMVYSFAKAQKGSQQFWELSASILTNLTFKQADDISFCIWAFAKMKINNLKFWNSIIDRQLQLWNKVSLSDIENTTWALQRIDIPELWEKILTKQIFINHKAISVKFNDFDELLTIGKRLYELNFTQTYLFQSLVDRIKYIIDIDNFDFTEVKRLVNIKYYLLYDKSLINEKLISQLLKCLHNKQSSTTYINYVGNLSFLIQEIDFYQKDFIIEIKKAYKQIDYSKIKEDQKLFELFLAGSVLLDDQDDQIITSLIKEEFLELSLSKNISHLCTMINILSKYYKSKPFFERLRDNNHQKSDIFICLFFNMLHNNKYVVPQENYKHIINILNSIFQSKDKKKFQNKFIDLLINKPQNFNLELKDLFQNDIFEFLKPYDGYIEVQLLKEKQEQIRKQRVEFQSQIDFNKQQFIDITKTKNQFMQSTFDDNIQYQQQ